MTKTPPPARLRATYRQRGSGWEGVVKQGNKTVAACGHHHRNRDQTTGRSGPSARHCAAELLQTLERQS